MLAGGLVAVLSGVAIFASSLAPIFGLGAQTATLTRPVLISTSELAPVDAQSMENALQPLIGVGSSALLLDHPVNGVAFDMSVPALGYHAIVLEGVATGQLSHGPGHYPTSAWPGHVGNVGIAAHNVYWLGFARLSVGDQVQLQTRRGLFVYQITGSKIVDPGDRSIMVQTTDHRLTLTTCWPLWAGAYATKRLVFNAVEVGGAS